MSDIEQQCECAVCALKIDFSMDNHLIEEIEKSNAIIFAGAGISTEAKSVFPDSFYSQICHEIGGSFEESFPELMQKFVDQPNGRQKLISKIQDRFDHIDSWDDMKHNATRFHNEIATMPYFSKIVTTNWDRYFEDFSGAKPFVYDSDIVFWELANRAVLKIHGSIDNYSTLVATEEDYAESQKRLTEGAVGAVLKQILATRTCIFIGYSLSDSNFLQIYNVIKDKLGSFNRTHYYVSPFISEDDITRLKRLNIKTIQTDGTYFLSTVKEHMCTKFCYARDETYEEIFHALRYTSEVHLEFVESYSPAKYPHLICCTFYQDGLIHAFKRILDLKKTGKYSDLHRLQGIIYEYDKTIAKHLSTKNYTEYSYYKGYRNGLIYFLICNDYDVEENSEEENSLDDLIMEEGIDVNPEEVFLPLYFHPKVGEIFHKEEFDKLVRENPSVHKGALRQCKKKLAKLGNPEVIQHMPW